MSIEKETNAIRRMVRSPWRVNYRKTAEETFGPLEGKEVHHRNKDHTDSRPENLLPLSPQAHRAHHTRQRQRAKPQPAAKLRKARDEVVKVKRARWR